MVGIDSAVIGSCSRYIRANFGVVLLAREREQAVKPVITRKNTPQKTWSIKTDTHKTHSPKGHRYATQLLWRSSYSAKLLQ